MSQITCIYARGLLVMEWIRIEDKSPEEGSNVIVTYIVRIGGKRTRAMKLAKYVDGQYRQVVMGAMYKIYEVVAWMYMPEAYQG